MFGIFGRKKKQPADNKSNNGRSVVARFDSAQTTKDNIRHWSMADALSADASVNSSVRKKVRERARYEVTNNSYARGLVQMLANDTIGTGPRLQIITENDNVGNRIEKDFSDWAKKVKLSQKLRIMRIARCQDGESFAVFKNNPKLESVVKLDFGVIETDRVSSEYFEKNIIDESYIDGIKFDSYGNPLNYRILKHHPGSNTSSYLEADIVPAEYVMHTFIPVRPEQHRGISELVTALPLFAQLRRYNLAALSAAEAAADFAAILYTDTPPDGETETVEPMDSIPLERNMMMTVPAGWKMSQLEAKHPTANHAEFVKVILSEVARSVCSTYGTIAGDFSGFNYASGRLDNQIYQKSILVDRSVWENEVLYRIFRMWFREYSLVTGVSSRYGREFVWFWDSFMHVDPAKEANAVSTKLANNTTTLASEYAKQGLDWRNELAQRAKEIDLMRKLGITNESFLKDGKESEEENE